MRARWIRFWFEPVSGMNLGLCRVVFFAAILALYRDHDFSAWADAPRRFWTPISFFKLLRLPILPARILRPMRQGWLLSLGLSSIGLFTGLSTRASFLLGTYLLGLSHNFAKINHSDGMVVFVLGIMALARCGDRVSADRALTTAVGRADHQPPARAKSGEYTWPIRMVWLLISLVFFGAGVSKLRQSGRRWFDGDKVANLLIQYQYKRADPDPSPWPLFVARFPLLCRIMAFGTVAIEVGYPLALVSRRARWVLVPGSIVLLSGIRVLLGPNFPTFVACSIFWIPWDRVHDRLLAPVARAGEAARRGRRDGD